MNRGDIVSMLESEARRRPVVADLLARVETLTDEEIDSAPVPLKWYKDALKEARRRKEHLAIQAALDEIARMQPENEVATSENLKRGLTLEYTGERFWAKARRGFQIEVITGDLLFFPEDGSGAWLNQTFFDSPPMQLSSSKRITDETRYDYLLRYQKKLLSEPCESNLNSGTQQPNRGFTIYR